MIDCIWLCSSGWVETKCDPSEDHHHSIIAKGRPIDKCMFNYLDQYYKEEFDAIRNQDIQVLHWR